MPSRARRRRLASVRVRTTLAATAVVSVALIIGAFALVGILRHTMVSNVDGEIALRADDVAAAAARGDLPATLAGGVDDETVAQAVSTSGRVVAQSRGVRGNEPIASVVGVGARDVVRTIHRPPMGDGAAYRVLARRVAAADGPLVLLVGGSLEPTTDSINTVMALLAVGIPALILLAAALAWWMVGKTLKPVESIRREVDAISNDALDRRIPEPATADEIGRLAHTMNDMLDRLEASRNRERRFVADAAHELRSPLTNIRTQLEVALAHPDQADWPALASSVHDQHDRIGSLVENLLVLARADEGKLGLRRQVVDLDELVLEPVEAVRNRRRVRVDLSRVAGGRVSGDPIELERAIRNLVDNAERHAVSTICIEIAPHPERVELAVEDDGAGIRDDDRDRVFERFTRLDDDRSRTGGGAGLGLAIVREIVRAHHGTVVVVDAQRSPSGARVIVSLPRAPARSSPAVEEVRSAS